MSHTETIGSKGGNANFINVQTGSTTAAFAEGAIISLDSNGYGISCATAVDIKTIGVLANGLKALDSAAQRNLSVQTSGIVKLYGWKDSTTGYQTSIVPGERVMVGDDSDSAYTGQVVVHADAAATTTSDFNTDGRKPIGIALDAMSTAGTRTAINVLLTL